MALPISEGMFRSDHWTNGVLIRESWKSPGCWAFVAHPGSYRIADAVHDPLPKLFTTKGKSVAAGDRAVIWKAKGQDDHRSVVALATVLRDPEIVTDDTSFPDATPCGGVAITFTNSKPVLLRSCRPSSQSVYCRGSR
jgi:hypothetical protein